MQMKAESLYQVRIVEEFNEFLLLEEHWYLLCQSSVELCPMMTFGWLVSWWRTFGSGLCMHLITIWDKNMLIAAAPMAIQQNKWGFFQHTALIGWINTWVDRYFWLVDKRHPSALLSILNYLHENNRIWDELYLQRQVVDINQTRDIAHYFGSRSYRVICQDDLQSPTMIFPGSYEELIGNLSGTFRQSLRRKVKAVDKREDIKMWISRDSECEQAIFDISPDTWQHQQGTSMLATTDIQRFFHDIIGAAAKEKTLVAGVMTINDEFAAFELNIKSRDKLYNLKLGYKSNYADLSPGVVLKNFMLRSLINNNSNENFVEYDLMGTTEAYKLNWTKTIRSHQTMRIFPKTVKNVFWLIKYQYKDWLKESSPKIFSLLKKIKMQLSK